MGSISANFWSKERVFIVSYFAWYYKHLDGTLNPKDAILLLLLATFRYDMFFKRYITNLSSIPNEEIGTSTDGGTTAKTLSLQMNIQPIFHQENIITCDNIISSLKILLTW